MSFDIVISEQANTDIRYIYEYIAFELLAPDNAINQLKRIENSIMSLNEMPERYRQYDVEPWQSRGLRVMPVDHYIVFYIP